MSEGTTDHLAAVIAPPREPDLRLAQVVSTQGLNDTPPTITIGDGEVQTVVRVIGNSWDYHPGDTVVYTHRPGMSTVLGTLAAVGSETEQDDDDYQPWHEVGAAGEPAFQNSWVNFGGVHDTAAFWMQTDGWVRLKGLIKSGTVAAGTTIFDLPPGWAPPWKCYFVINSNSAAAVIQVTTAGQVQTAVNINNAFVQLNGITFPASWTLLTSSHNKLNRGYWELPLFEPGWNKSEAVTDSEIEFYVRSDGWVWWKGVVDTGTVPGPGMHFLGRTAPGWQSHLMLSHGSAGGRIDIGGGTGTSNRGPRLARWEAGGGAGQDHYVGGINYFGYGALRTEHDVPGVEPTLLNGWTHFGFDFQRVRYHKDIHGVVHLSGMADGAAASTTTIFNLPVGFRPGLQQLFAASKFSNTTGRIDIEADGDVVATLHALNGYQSLSSISFRAVA